jgi:signal transduction histidine kinase
MEQGAKSLPREEVQDDESCGPTLVRSSADGVSLATEHFEALADELSDGVAVVRNARLEWLNERLVALAGRSDATELIGSIFSDLLKDCGRGLPGDADARFVECGLRRPDGELRTVVCRLAWSDADSQSSGWVIEDVTHVRMLEAELLRLSRKVHQTNREVVGLTESLRRDRADREEMLTVVSHELRTPVTVISGYHRLLLSGEVGPLNTDQRRFLEESAKGCRRLDAFIADLLEVSRIRCDQTALEVSTGSLREVIEAASAMLRPLLEERDLRIETEIPPDADRAQFDRMRLDQVFTNLIGNAIKHSPPEGIIEISSRQLPQADPEERPLIEISIADDGPGVPEADRSRIFEAYVQAGEYQRAGGLGIGLAVCKHLVEAHGGTISVVGRNGGGSRFVFTLPTPAALGGV